MSTALCVYVCVSLYVLIMKLQGLLRNRIRTVNRRYHREECKLDVCPHNVNWLLTNRSAFVSDFKNIHLS